MAASDHHSTLMLPDIISRNEGKFRKPRYSLPDIRQSEKPYRRTSLQERSTKKKEHTEVAKEEVVLQLNDDPTKMYIVVKYADNQSLIVNPMCSVVNLLSSIKSRTGHAEDTEMVIDLSDETGLIQDLEVHGREYATKFLSTQGTYILMKKQLLMEGQAAKATTIQHALQSYDYVPLLEQCTQIYPNFKIHLSEAQKKKLKPLKNVNKSPSPAGKMGTTKTNPSAGHRSVAGRPPRSGSRTKSKH